ncbi:nucleotidyltransferase domain-containing protein [Candidatus Electrothrix sp.]|uniref:nucleotidyltransferase domain-containing protein n=1 Tax=Candidatus Electrothrix sp. TaxID=2170559 RepID=UPI004057AD88
MKYGLSRKNVDNIKRVFARFKEVNQAILYGSRAKGNYKPGSDIDIALKGEKLNLRLLNKIDFDLDELFLPYTFDISIYDHISNKDLVAHIQRVGKILYKKNSVQQDHK